MLNFEQWNEKMAKKYDPDKYHQSPSLIIRLIEKRRRKAIFDSLDIQLSDSVIDIGCGAGNILELVQAQKVVGLDISDYLLSKARQKLAGRGAILIKGNAENLPPEILSRKFDKIISSEVIEHVEHPEKLIEQIINISTPQTRIVITIPNEDLIYFIRNLLVKSGLFKLFFPKISPQMSEEWHRHHFNLKKLDEVVGQKLIFKKVRRVPLFIFPIHYVITYQCP